MELTVLIKAPELANAINSLAAAIANPTAAPVTPSQQAAAPVAVPQQATAPVAVPQQAAASVTPAQPTAASMGFTVPTANPPQYTVEQIMAAGATLVDAGRVQELMNLLQSFGVQAVTNLRPEQLGAFATELRKMGASI